MIPVALNDVDIGCINRAAMTYYVPVPIILSVMKKENGRNGQVVINKDGTHDYGVMQINDVWRQKFYLTVIQNMTFNMTRAKT